MFDTERDPTEVPSEQLEREIAELAAHIYAATCRWLCLICEFERRECHLAWGFHSTTAWLAWTCGLTPRAAREHVRVARALAELPLVREAFERGELSYSKVRALTRAAEPGTEAELLELAQQATAAQLERSVRAYRSALALAEGRPPADTFFAWAWEDDGTLSVRGRLAPDEGALLIEAMHHARRLAAGPGCQPSPADGEPAPAPVTNTDALAALAESSLSGAGPSAGGDRHQVVLHLHADGRRELGEGSAICEAAARRLLCDASLVAPGGGGGGAELAAGGRPTRTIPATIRRALRARDGGCRFPGCGHERFVDAHHIHHFADGGETTLDNLVHLCRRHHRLVHEGGFGVERDQAGQLVFRRPDGTAVRTKPVPIRGEAAAIADRRRRPPRPASGDRLDLGLTVECMLAAAQRAAAQSPSDNSVPCSPARPASVFS